jgi:RHS repeat-associated protein
VEVDGNAVTREGRNWKFLLNAAGSGSELRIQEYVVQAARADLVPEVGDEINETVTFRPTSVSLTHDDDGNLTFDGRWHYEWDAENRLIGMEEAAARFVDSVGTGDYERAVRLEFAYDALGRRVRKKVLDAPRNALGERSGVWVLKKETVFVWQDWRMLAEYVKTPEITMLQLRRSYLWGMDLVSGVYEAGMAENAAALSPAGGVGGLLWVVDYLPGQSTSNRQLAPWYDGNGNILGWVENELAQVQPLHRLEYDAFGRLLVDDPVRVALTKKQSDLGAAEAWLDRPAFGFSTKYEDWETGLLYYGHRYYAPEVGRWVGRDPIEERGGLNLYGMVGNDAVNSIDVLGLAYPGVEDRNQGFATPDWLPKVSGIAGRKGWGHLQQLFDEWFGHPSFRITNAQDVKLNDPYNNTIISYGWLIGFDRARLQFEKLNNKNTYRGGNERERLRNRIRALGPNTHRFGEDWMNETDPRKLHQHWVGRQDVRGSRISMDALDGALHNFAVYSVVSGCLHKDGDGYSAFITDYVVYAKDSFDFEGSQHLGYWAEPDSVSYLFPTPGSRAVSNNSFQDFRAAKGRGRDFFVFSKPKKFKVKGPAWKVRL